MYYDRTIDDPLAATIVPGGPLSWLMDHVRSGGGRDRHAHVQFRRDRNGRHRGSVQLYWGRTSPLEFRLRGDGRVSFHADPTYRNLSEQLFSEPVGINRLHARRDDFHDHLERSWKVLSDPSSSERRRAFVTGEAVCHAGFMRRYGHDWRAGDPLLAIDSEARVGFGRQGKISGTERQRADDAATREHLQLDASVTIPRKLDALGILPSGDVALVEIKDADGSISRALVQAAAHAVRYSHLMAHGGLRDTLGAMIHQKAATGVLPPGCPRPGQAPRIVPCVAAPDTSPDWPAGWSRDFDRCGQQLRAALADLIFIRLHADGRIQTTRPADNHVAPRARPQPHNRSS